MRLHVIQHIPFEDEANIHAWADDRGHGVSRSRLYAEDPFPSLDSYDCLVIMGGFMGVYDYEEFPWLYREKTVILDAIEAGRHVLGVCLGAQLIADVLGATVHTAEVPEIGWFPVSLTPEGRNLPMLRGLPDRFPALHWHHDTFDIPQGAVRIAETDVCPNQGFVLGDRVAGLQFHVEYSHDDLRTMVEHCGHELEEDAPTVQSGYELLQDPSRTDALRSYLDAFLDVFLGQTPGQSSSPATSTQSPAAS